MDLQQIKEKFWDYIIVGTGMGGGTLGLKLAQSGFSVLFLEKGAPSESVDALKGQFAELFQSMDKIKIYSRAGRSSQKFVNYSINQERSVEPFLGCGVGGSSALYGTVLQRFKEIDFKTWPLSYSEFSNYYEEAEKLFRVRTSKDYIHPDLKFLSHYLKDCGLHPYILPLAHDNNSECGQCQSYLCARNCKNDAGKICIKPALELYKAEILENCEALKIEITKKLATSISVKHQSETYSLNAKNIVLAAGALYSPLLLLASQTQDFPNGIGNNSGMTGRYLMRHYVDLYALDIDSEPENPSAKEIGFDDFYFLNGQKYGTVQSFGRLPPFQVVFMSLKISCLIFKIIHPIVKWFLKLILQNRLVLSSIMEDSPNYENRVWKSGSKIFIQYQISKDEKKKIRFIRSQLSKIFKPFNFILIKSAEKNEMLAHACGTCRMGENPETSVVNSNNQVHGVNNLWVVDSSFFPTSGGTNPGLTIAANALRVAEYIINQSKSKEKGHFV